jgi:hypothetical protein
MLAWTQGDIKQTVIPAKASDLARTNGYANTVGWWNKRGFEIVHENSLAEDFLLTNHEGAR